MNKKKEAIIYIFVFINILFGALTLMFPVLLIKIVHIIANLILIWVILGARS
jgi:hypothetical protein